MNIRDDIFTAQAPEPDGLPHHWEQGPGNLVRLYAPINYFNRHWEWQFCWFLETPDAILGTRGDDIRGAVDYILNRHGLGWHRAGVHFSEVPTVEKAHIVLRFSDASPVGWGDLPWAPGWWYHDYTINKSVAQITAHPEVFRDFYMFAALVGMELAGHGCFRMHDMYTAGHIPYTGVMGTYHPKMIDPGFPSLLEIEDARAWLKGQALHVHQHEAIQL